MRGHDRIAERRRSRDKPAMVWVLCDGYSVGMTRLQALGCALPDVIELKHSDNPKRLDLRCLIGLTVEVSGSDQARVGAVARACVAAGAAQVIAVAQTVTPRGEEFDVHTDRITFTNEEVELWPA
jgi:hypothetical protein